MREKITSEVITIFPFADENMEPDHLASMGYLWGNNIPEYSGVLRFNISIRNGLTREEWETFKASGDRIFQWMEDSL